METKPPAEIPPDVLADLDYAIRLAMTGQRDPEFEARVRAESEKITEALREKYGELNIAVDLIREGRDEE
jgi:hypothetical protein